MTSHKKFLTAFTILCSVLISQQTFSQNNSVRASDLTYSKTTYDGFSDYGISLRTGINNSVGFLGVGAYFKIQENLYGEVGAGLGLWGYVGAIQAQYYLPTINNIYVSAGIKRSGGYKDGMLELETIHPETLELVSKEVSLDYLPVYNTQLVFGKTWTIRGQHRFFLEGGYSFFWGEHEDTYKVVDSNITLSESSKSVLKVLTPGGIVFGLGFSFGIK